MRHLLMDPAFPDIVCQWAAQPEDCVDDCANDNDGEAQPNDFSDPLLTRLAELEIAATRLW